MLHYIPTTWSITWFFTWDYMQHHSITCSITWQLHDQLHDSIHTQLPTITSWCTAWHEISWVHDHVFLVQPFTPKKSPSLSASCAQDRRRRLWRLMRGLLERILLSCPKHENTWLESVRIIKAPHLFSGQLWATAKFIELGTPSHSKINRAWNSKPPRN